LKQSLFEDDDEEDDDDDEEEDDFIDTESLGDWRTVRRNLALGQQDRDESPKTKTKKTKSVSKENEEILLQQNEDLAQEYITGVWAHEVATVSAVVLLLSCYPVCGNFILSTFRYISSFSSL
jgi:ABC-type nitrate/sulfonate/bicarbonate transport system ATPase subunit